MSRCVIRHPRSSILHSRVWRYRGRRNGAIFVTAIWILIILGAMVLVTASAVHTDATASANGLSAVQADAIELGAEQWVLSQVDGVKGDAVGVTGMDTEAMQVGDGYFWILHPDPDQDQTYGFGIVDESSKLNLNSAKSEQLQLLPGMTSDVADAIVDWRDADDTPGDNGAESSFYLTLPIPYAAKNSAFETVEELKLVLDPKQLTPDPLFGYDLNRDGVLDDYERGLAGGGTMGTAVNSGVADTRGLFNYVTVYSVEPNTTVDGAARVNVNVNDTSALQQVLTDALQQKRATEIMSTLLPVYAKARRAAGIGTGGASGGKTGKTGSTSGASGATTVLNAFPNPPTGNGLGQFYQQSKMTPDEFKLVADKLTSLPATTKKLTGMVNINTAPRQVLMCLPGITDSDADLLVSQRTGNSDTQSIAWIFSALTADKAAAIVPYITARSFVYSADIVAVSGNGRAYKRVRIVVDAQQSPAKILYRRDLTSLGWPLDRQIQDSMRSGQFQPNAMGLGSGGGGGGGTGFP